MQYNSIYSKLIQGHRIPVLPKPLSQMKTTETRSYLSRLIWATNGWKRPQYGNPETKPVWWPNDLLNWAEMKKMGGKKADGLSNVNYNEIQKTILNEVCIVCHSILQISEFVLDEKFKRNASKFAIPILFI